MPTYSVDRSSGPDGADPQTPGAAGHDGRFPPKNLDDVLAPISAESPAGEPLRYTGIYDKVREARRADDPSLPQGEWQSALKRADFAAAASLCFDALAHRSKDLQLGVWLAEAWAQSYGVRGVAVGLRMLAKLCDRFWETMFPALAEGVDARVALLDWLDDTLALRLRLTPLSSPSAGAPFSVSDWEMARAGVGRDNDEAGTMAWEAVLSRTSQSGRGHWQALHADLGEILRARDELERATLARTGAPSVLPRMADVLRNVAGVVEYAMRALGADPAGASGSGSGSAVASATSAPVVAHFALAPTIQSASATGAAAGPIQTRAEAYLRLSEAADFLLRTEPHSPVPYLIMRAVSWGNMSLGELLHEFVNQTDDLVAIQVLLGMRRRD
jgi:type VI secretion system protein ImpA